MSSITCVARTFACFCASLSLQFATFIGVFSHPAPNESVEDQMMCLLSCTLLWGINFISLSNFLQASSFRWYSWLPCNACHFCCFDAVPQCTYEAVIVFLNVICQHSSPFGRYFLAPILRWIAVAAHCCTQHSTFRTQYFFFQSVKVRTRVRERPWSLSMLRNKTKLTFIRMQPFRPFHNQSVLISCVGGNASPSALSLLFEWAVLYKKLVYFCHCCQSVFSFVTLAGTTTSNRLHRRVRWNRPLLRSMLTSVVVRLLLLRRNPSLPLHCWLNIIRIK